MWRRLRSRVGHRGTVLLFFGFLDWVYALSLLKPAPDAVHSSNLRFVAQLAPLWAWALVWAAAGAVLLVGAFTRRDGWAYATAMFIKVLWGMVFLLGWLFADLNRGWVSAAIWLALALMLLVVSDWPEPAGEVPHGHVPDGGDSRGSGRVG